MNFFSNNSLSGDNREDAFDKDQGEAVFAIQRRCFSDLLQTIFTRDDCKEQVLVIIEKMLLIKIRVRWCLQTRGGVPQICCK